MKRSAGTFFVFFIVLLYAGAQQGPSAAGPAIFGFLDAKDEIARETQFLAVPDPNLAREHLQSLTKAPHMAGTPEDKATADYVAAKFREAGLDTQLVEYRVWLSYPKEISVDVTAPEGVKMHGPSREHVNGDPYQDDPRVVTAYNGQSPSGDVEAEVVYANYGRPEDFKKLQDMKVDVKGKIVLVRYGQNFRGVKTYVAQERGAAGVIIFSDPIDDGWFKGDKYTAGPWRPDTGVQRGSIGFMFEYPGDPTTPGVASVPSLPDSERTPPQQAASLPKIPTTPLSYADAWPILQNLSGPDSPREWQGALPFTYHLGPGPVRVKMHINIDYGFRTIWDVIGKVPGREFPQQWVVAGNHRDAWVYGAVDPNSGTTALLEAVHGIGQLLKAGWKPKRTVVLASWDAEEQGLIGSTEWGEEHAKDLANAVAYFNVDVAVSGPNFGASSVPSLKQFVRDIAKAVPSPKGGTVYEQWRKSPEGGRRGAPAVSDVAGLGRPTNAPASDVAVGDLGSGSDYTVFLQHLGVPATDIGSTGPYGVYHSAFDNYNWFTKFADPTFVYEQEMARVYGLEVIRMSDADILPFDYQEYAREIAAYIDTAKRKAQDKFGAQAPSFTEVEAAAKHMQDAAASMAEEQKGPNPRINSINERLMLAERTLLLPDGLPNRPWFKHAIYAPGVYTGYAAVVIPGVNEAIDAGDRARTEQQLSALAAALTRAVTVLYGRPAGFAGAARN